MQNDNMSKQTQAAWPFAFELSSDPRTLLCNDDVQKFDSITVNHFLEQHVLTLVPEQAIDIERLQALMESQRLPTITVIGKYNHGKSQLLNELIGQSIFKVEDKRTTLELNSYVHEGVCWLDAPGLDADVENEDDRHALRGAWLESDIRLFVHSAKEGELDSLERDLLETLRADDASTKRQTLLVLSQVDQLANDADLSQVCQVMSEQVPGMTIYTVSSTRYRQGLDGGKKLLIEKSGLLKLNSALADAVAQVQTAREHEIAMLSDKLEMQLTKLIKQRNYAIETLRAKQEFMKQQFNDGLNAAMTAAYRQLQEV